VKRDLACLKVSSPEQCLEVLTYSGRVYEDMDLENSVVLLPWKEIFYITETRCFVINRKLRCFTQYYDIEPPEVHQIYKLILEFFQEYSVSYLNCVVDIHCPDYSKVEVVEINPLDKDTETGYFTWEEIFNINNIEYRYQGGKLIH
jgi:hypothetical protein